MEYNFSILLNILFIKILSNLILLIKIYLELN
jgi:hypothetical protein